MNSKKVSSANYGVNKIRFFVFIRCFFLNDISNQDSRNVLIIVKTISSSKVKGKIDSEERDCLKQYLNPNTLDKIYAFGIKLKYSVNFVILNV